MKNNLILLEDKLIQNTKEYLQLLYTKNGKLCHLNTIYIVLNFGLLGSKQSTIPFNTS
jgi:hypothetical protein